MNLDKDMERHKFNLQQVLAAYFKAYENDESCIYVISVVSSFLTHIEYIRCDKYDVDEIPNLKLNICAYLNEIGLKV